MEHRYPTTGRLLAFIRNQVGNPADLTTEAKANVVAALNELEGRFDHYEPKLRFNSTPVYSVTLAEDVTVFGTSPYIITAEQLGGEYRHIWCHISCNPAPQMTGAADIVVGIHIDDETRMLGINNAIFVGQNRTSVAYTNIVGNRLILIGGNYATSSRLPLNLSDGGIPIFLQEGKFITAIRIYHFSGAYFPAGSTFTIYAAEEV